VAVKVNRRFQDSLLSRHCAIYSLFVVLVNEQNHHIPKKILITAVDLRRYINPYWPV